MEDTGTFQAITYLHPTGKVNKDRVMVLRTASNYTTQPPGMTAAEHLLRENEGYAGLNALGGSRLSSRLESRRRDRCALEHLSRPLSRRSALTRACRRHRIRKARRLISSTGWTISRRCRKRCSWRFSTCLLSSSGWSRRRC